MALPPIHGIWNDLQGVLIGAAATVAADITPLHMPATAAGQFAFLHPGAVFSGSFRSRGRISGPRRSFGRTREFVFCRTVRDMAAALDVLSDPHPGDPFISWSSWNDFAHGDNRGLEVIASVGLPAVCEALSAKL